MKKIVTTFAALAIGGAGYFLGLKHEENKAVLSTSSGESATPDEQGKLLRLVNDSGTILPVPRSKTWGKTSFDDIRLTLNYQTDVRPTSLRVGRNTPNGTKFSTRFPKIVVNLPLEFYDDFEGFNKWGDINKGYYVQVAEHDFDSDGVPEIVVAVGNDFIDLVVNVVKYHAPQSADDAGRPENWSLIGSFPGQQKAYLKKDSIIMPFGSQGRFKEYTWVKSKFVETY